MAEKGAGVSDLEDELAWLMKVAKLPVPQREHKFWPSVGSASISPGRSRWWPSRSKRVVGQRSSLARSHFESDCVKYNEAALKGWKCSGSLGHDPRWKGARSD